MKISIFLSFFLFLGLQVFAQSPIGVWKTIDDETGKAKSYVEIYQASNGKLQGKVTKILTVGKENAKCDKCKGKNKDKAILGMNILWGLSKDGDSWTGGTILDPNKGKEYSCNVKVNGDKLTLRGYVGISLVGRSQTWERVK